MRRIGWVTCSLLAAMNVSHWSRANTTSSQRYDNFTLTLEHLLEDYDLLLRPNYGGDPIFLGINMMITSIDGISEVNMDFTLTMYLRQFWRDDRLAFSSHDDVFTLSSDFIDKIWLPDTFFDNDKQGVFHEITEKNTMVHLRGDGTITYGLRFTSTVACAMDLRSYPLDSQNCSIEISSYGYTVRDVVMYWRSNPVEGLELIKMPQFSVVRYDTRVLTQPEDTGHYQTLILSFKFSRHVGYFIFQAYLPCFLIVMLSWVSFWINHDATSARIGLGITTVLTMTTINSGIRASLPRVSYVKAIDIYLVTCFVFVFAALLEYSALHNTFRGKKIKRKAKKSKEDAGKPVTVPEKV